VADHQNQFLVRYRPFITSDFDQTQQNVRGESAFVPVGELSTGSSTQALAGAGLSAAGDILTITVGTHAIQGGGLKDMALLTTHFSIVLYSLTDIAAWPALFENYAMASTNGSQDNKGNSLEPMMAETTLSAERKVIGIGDSTRWQRRCVPAMQDYPPWLIHDTGTIDDWYAAAQFTVQTFDAASETATIVNCYWRALAFPLSAVRSGSFYHPRLSYRTGNAALA